MGFRLDFFVKKEIRDCDELICVLKRENYLILVGDIERDLRQIFYDIAKEKDVEIKALEIMPDHVHMFISFDPRQSLHSLIRYFKGTSSRILRNKYPELRSRIPSLWTRSYFCCTVGYVSEEAIQKYIESQKNV